MKQLGMIAYFNIVSDPVLLSVEPIKNEPPKRPVLNFRLPTG
jgi:hypothetical protein